MAKVQGELSVNIKNAVLSVYNDKLQSSSALDTTETRRSDFQDVSWGNPSAGVINLDPSVNNGRISLTIDSGSTGADAIKYVLLINKDAFGNPYLTDSDPNASAVLIELPVAEEFPNGGKLIITSMSGTILDEQV